MRVFTVPPWVFTALLWVFTVPQWVFTAPMWVFTVPLWVFTALLQVFKSLCGSLQPYCGSLQSLCGSLQPPPMGLTVPLWVFTIPWWVFTVSLWVFRVLMWVFTPQTGHVHSGSYSLLWVFIVPSQVLKLQIPQWAFTTPWRALAAGLYSSMVSLCSRPLLHIQLRSVLHRKPNLILTHPIAAHNSLLLMGRLIPESWSALSSCSRSRLVSAWYSFRNSWFSFSACRYCVMFWRCSCSPTTGTPLSAEHQQEVLLPAQ